MTGDSDRPAACRHWHVDWLPCDDHLLVPVRRALGSNDPARRTLLLGDNYAATPQARSDALDWPSHRLPGPGAQQRSPRRTDHRPLWARSILWVYARQLQATLVAW